MKKYLRKQFQASQFLLDHHSPSDCYLSCWQNNRSPWPLLCVRVIIFLGCLGILLASMILTGMEMNFGYWFIFLTHWGLVINTVASCFGVVVSLRACLKGPIEPSLNLPWYAKAFWATYDIAIVLAFFITVYYFAFLQFAYDEDMEFIDPTLDLFIHGINSVLMFFLLMTSQLPGRILHFIYPLCLGVIFLIFSVIHYFVGGTDPFGNNFIYPTLDWAKPGPTSIALLVTTIFLIIMHEIVVLMTACRNWLARRCGGGRSRSMDIPYS